MNNKNSLIHIKVYGDIPNELTGVLLFRFLSNKNAIEKKVCKEYEFSDGSRYIVNVRDHRKSLCITISKIK